jgi:hypothetical protein
MPTLIEIIPTDRNDLLNKAKSHYKKAFRDLPQASLLNSGMGSGKTKILYAIPRNLIAFKGVCFLLVDNQPLMDQIIQDYDNIPEKGFMELVSVKDAKVKEIKNAITTISAALSKGKTPIIILKNVGHNNGNFNKSASTLASLMTEFRKYDQLVLIDELDLQLTTLTGGINAKLDHTPDILKTYTKLTEQMESRNIFDLLQLKPPSCPY